MLRTFEQNAGGESLKPRAAARGRGAKKPDSGGMMVDVPVGGYAQHHSAVTAKYTEEELKALAAYYGAHPTLLEGFDYLRNAER